MHIYRSALRDKREILETGENTTNTSALSRRHQETKEVFPPIVEPKAFLIRPSVISGLLLEEGMAFFFHSPSPYKLSRLLSSPIMVVPETTITWLACIEGQGHSFLSSPTPKVPRMKEMNPGTNGQDKLHCTCGHIAQLLMLWLQLLPKGCCFDGNGQSVCKRINSY